MRRPIMPSNRRKTPRILDVSVSLFGILRKKDRVPIKHRMIPAELLDSCGTRATTDEHAPEPATSAMCLPSDSASARCGAAGDGTRSAHFADAGIRRGGIRIFLLR